MVVWLFKLFKNIANTSGSSHSTIMKATEVSVYVESIDMQCSHGVDIITLVDVIFLSTENFFLLIS